MKATSDKNRSAGLHRPCPCTCMPALTAPSCPHACLPGTARSSTASACRQLAGCQCVLTGVSVWAQNERCWRHASSTVQCAPCCLLASCMIPRYGSGVHPYPLLGSFESCVSVSCVHCSVSWYKLCILVQAPALNTHAVPHRYELLQSCTILTSCRQGKDSTF
jgi:hypothetical protein